MGVRAVSDHTGRWRGEFDDDPMRPTRAEAMRDDLELPRPDPRPLAEAVAELVELWESA